MHVSNVEGSGSIERNSERAVQIPRPDDVRRVPDSPVEDKATISRDGLHVVESHADALRSTDPQRHALVEAARQRLRSGALDDPAVYRATAEALLRDE